MNDQSLDLDAIKQRAEEMPPGPWGSARSDIPALISEVERLRTALGDVYRDSLTLWVEHVGDDIHAVSEAADLVKAIRGHARAALAGHEGDGV